jgi:phosphinothricin acetyltransferase
MRDGDWEAVRAIYAEGIATGNATFETVVPSWHVWDDVHRPTPRLVATIDDAVVAWGAVVAASSRPVYEGVAEISLYVAERARGQGVGKALLGEFIQAADDAGVWTLQTSVFPENETSLKLLEGCGFRVVGLRERIGNHRGRWRDTVLLERRSEVIE